VVARVLYISSSIGLGHASRDLAIAARLRELRPDIEIDWLAGEPARGLIEEAGERVLPEADAFGETDFAESQAGAFSLNIVAYVRRAAGAWIRAARAYFRATRRSSYDLAIGDETYELAVAFTLRPKLKRLPFVIIYDFLGLDATTRSPLERLIVHITNRIWGGGHRSRPPPEDLVLFVGEPDDVPDRPLGWRLPNRREYARRNFEFLGYVFPFDPADYSESSSVKSALGYEDRPLIICTIGGTSVGKDLLELCTEAYPQISERVPGALMVLVCGPRLDASDLRIPAGVETRGYVPRLYEHFAASDLVITQAGGTTTLELTALRRPFIYFPLEGHFEQQLMVGERLRCHGAGERMVYSETTPAALAEKVVGLIGSEATWPAIPSDGADKAARLILAELTSASKK
jgi:UDP:flavonoid glycosyltransferase YjiC (YdhE family)